MPWPGQEKSHIPSILSLEKARQEIKIKKVKNVNLISSSLKY